MLLVLLVFTLESIVIVFFTSLICTVAMVSV